MEFDRKPFSVPARRDFLRSSVAAAGVIAASGGLTSALTACGSSGNTTKGNVSSSSGRQLQNLTFQLDWLENTEFGGTFLALDRGYFTQNGTDLTVLAGGPTVTVEPLIASNKAQIGLGGTDEIASAILKGGPFEIFGATMQKNPNCIMSLPSAPIHTPQDMIGKKIGVGQSDLLAFESLLKINKIDPSKIQTVPVQFDPTPLAEHQVDGYMGFYINEPAQLEVRGIKTVTFLFSDFGFEIYSDALYATTDTIDNHADLLAAFLRAERQGWTDALNDPQAATDAVINKYGSKLGLDPKQQLLEAQAMKSLMVTPDTEAHGLFYMSPESLPAQIQTLKDIEIDISSDQLFTSKILNIL